MLTHHSPSFLRICRPVILQINDRVKLLQVLAGSLSAVAEHTDRDGTFMVLRKSRMHAVCMMAFWPETDVNSSQLQERGQDRSGRVVVSAAAAERRSQR